MNPRAPAFDLARTASALLALERACTPYERDFLRVRVEALHDQYQELQNLGVEWANPIARELGAALRLEEMEAKAERLIESVTPALCGR